jgi:hypothetical protein
MGSFISENSTTRNQNLQIAGKEEESTGHREQQWETNRQLLGTFSFQ